MEITKNIRDNVAIGAVALVFGLINLKLHLQFTEGAINNFAQSFGPSLVALSVAVYNLWHTEGGVKDQKNGGLK